MSVPGREVVVSDRPVHGETITCRAFEVDVRPTVRVPRPRERSSADLVATYPVERLLLDVGVLIVRGKEVRSVRLVGPAAAGDRVGFAEGQRTTADVRKVPRPELCGRVVVRMLDRSSAFEDQGAEPAFAKLLCRPSSTDARADHDRVERPVGHRLPRHRVSDAGRGAGMAPANAVPRSPFGATGMDPTNQAAPRPDCLTAAGPASHCR